LTAVENPEIYELLVRQNTNHAMPYIKQQQQQPSPDGLKAINFKERDRGIVKVSLLMCIPQIVLSISN